MRKSEKVCEQSHIIDTGRDGSATARRYDNDDSYALLWMLYAAYKRTVAAVNVQIPNVRACNEVTVMSSQHKLRIRGIRQKSLEDRPGCVAGTLLYIRFVKLRVRKFCTVLNTAEAATIICHAGRYPCWGRTVGISNSITSRVFVKTTHGWP